MHVPEAARTGSNRRVDAADCSGGTSYRNPVGMTEWSKVTAHLVDKCNRLMAHRLRCFGKEIGSESGSFLIARPNCPLMQAIQSTSRLLKYASAENRFLQLNQKHQTAASHALKVYRSNSIYTFIPKNACSTMRLSLAIANCCISDASYVDWIHSNNDTFQASLQDLVVAHYTFVILRDPFARLASCFLDKIAAKAFPARQLRDLADRAIDLDEITFADFATLLGNATIRAGNMHWRPQIDFLVYDRYDDYFSVENLNSTTLIIEQRAGLQVVDARPLTAHGLDRYELLPESMDHSKTPVKEIARLKQNGVCPNPRSLYTRSIIEQISDFYTDDIELYSDKIAPSAFFRVSSSG